MATAAQIREAFEKMAKSDGPAVSNIAKVKSVDETKATCVLIDEDGQEFFNVRLRPVLTGNKSFILVPKVVVMCWPFVLRMMRIGWLLQPMKLKR